MRKNENNFQKTARKFVHFIKYLKVTPEHPEGEVQTKVIVTRKNS